MTITVVIDELPADDQRASGGPVEDTDAATLGMRLENLSEEERESFDVDGGVRVAEVMQGPAREAGIQAGDVLLQIRGEKIQDVEQVRAIAEELEAGKSVPVLVKRDARSLFLALKPGEADDE